MDRCPKDEPTAKNLVCSKSSSHSREKKLEKPVGVASTPSLDHRRVKNQENKLLTGALAELQKLNQTGNGSLYWLKKTEEIIPENNLNVASYGYTLKYKTFPEKLLPHKRPRKVLKSKLQTKFKEEWGVKTSNMMN